MASLFLRKVSKEYSIPFEELRDSVVCEFICDELDDLVLNREYFADTERFDNFVSEYEIKQVNIGAVVLYFKVVELEVSNTELSCDLKDTSADLAKADLEIISMKGFFTGVALVFFSVWALKK